MSEKDRSIHEKELKTQKRKRNWLMILLILFSSLLLASNAFWLGHNINRMRNKPKDSPKPLPTYTVEDSHRTHL